MHLHSERKLGMILHGVWRYSPVQWLIIFLKLAHYNAYIHVILYNQILNEIVSISAVLWYLQNSPPPSPPLTSCLPYFWYEFFSSLFSFNHMIKLCLYSYQIPWISRKTLLPLCCFFFTATCHVLYCLSIIFINTVSL